MTDTDKPQPRWEGVEWQSTPWCNTLCPKWRQKQYSDPPYCHEDGRFTGEEDDEHDRPLCLPAVRLMGERVAELESENDCYEDRLIEHQEQDKKYDARIAELECSAAEIDRLDMEMHEIDDDRAPVDVALDRITELEAKDHYNTGMAEQHIAETRRLQTIMDKLRKAWIKANEYGPVDDGSPSSNASMRMQEMFREAAEAAKENHQ